MGRMIRFIPPEGAVVEITYRTMQRRFLLKPSRELNQIVVGALARAQRLYGVKVYGVVVMSTHLHLLLGVRDAFQMARFMNHFGSKLAKEIGRRTGWREKIWSRRYRAIVVSQEDGAQIARLRYLLAHGVKEGLVHHPCQWLGVHCARPLLSGSSLRGVWFDRTRETLDQRRKGASQEPEPEVEVLHFDPLPCWEHLEPDVVRQRIAGMVEQIVLEAIDGNRRMARPVLGAERISRQSPFDQPSPSSEPAVPAPIFHTASKKAWKALMSAYRQFYEAFAAAAQEQSDVGSAVDFPPGSFPPSPPFVSPWYL